MLISRNSLPSLLAVVAFAQIGFLALFSPLVTADLVVTTTEDVDLASIQYETRTQPHCSWVGASGDKVCCGGGEIRWRPGDGECSLREAYEFSKILSRTSRVEYDFNEDYAICPTDPRRRITSEFYDADIRQQFVPFIPPIEDCFEEGDFPFAGTLLLPRTEDDKPYLLDSEIVFDKTIQLEGFSEFNKSKITNNPDSATPHQRLFLLEDNKSLVLENIELYGARGKAGKSDYLASNNGGLIYVNGGNLILNGVVLRDARVVGDGGLVYMSSFSKIRMSKVQMRNGSAGRNGGALFVNNDSRVDLDDTLLDGNRADSGKGGAIYQNGGKTALIFRNSLFEDNSAEEGGGLWASGNEVGGDFQNITFYDNRSTLGAGAIYWAGENLTLKNNTITGNSGGTVGGVEFGSDLQIYNSIIVGNENGDCLSFNSILADSQFSLFADDSIQGCDDVSTEESNFKLMLSSAELLAGNNPVLNAIARNKGLTRNFLPNPNAEDGVSVYDAGSSVTAELTCPADDQRGLTRQNSLCDIGAVEFQQAFGVADDVTAPWGTSVTIDVAQNDLGDTKMVCPDTSVPDPEVGPPPLQSVIEDGFTCIGILIEPDRGTLRETTNERGELALLYTPFGAYHGSDTFAYEFLAEHSVNDISVQALATVHYEPYAVSISEGGVLSAIEERGTEFSDIGGSVWLLYFAWLMGLGSLYRRFVMQRIFKLTNPGLLVVKE